MAEMKKIENEDLEKTTGGRAAFDALGHELRGMLPEEVKEKLKTVHGDVAVCKVLAENGIDVEKIEQKIKDAGFNLNKIGLQELPDEDLDKIAGGFKDKNAEVRCRCGMTNRSCFSLQVFDTLFLRTAPVENFWRCKNCNTNITPYKDGTVKYFDPIDF